jgi:hypothetical protein
VNFNPLLLLPPRSLPIALYLTSGAPGLGSRLCEDDSALEMRARSIFECSLGLSTQPTSFEIIALI